MVGRIHCLEDVTILGMLEVDSNGNVNASRKGEKTTDFVGPGGFPDFSTAAQTVIFVGSWFPSEGYVAATADSQVMIC